MIVLCDEHCLFMRKEQLLSRIQNCFPWGIILCLVRVKLGKFLTPLCKRHDLVIKFQARGCVYFLLNVGIDCMVKPPRLKQLCVLTQLPSFCHGNVCSDFVTEHFEE